MTFASKVDQNSSVDFVYFKIILHLNDLRCISHFSVMKLIKFMDRNYINPLPDKKF